MRKKALISVLLVCILAISATIASAHVIYANRLNGGIGRYDAGISRPYWIDSSLKTNLVTQAISSWRQTSQSTQLYLRQTTNRPSSIADYYPSSILGNGTRGITTFFLWSGTEIQGPNPNQNWDFCRIYINTTAKATGTAPLNDWEYTRTSAHELGHVFGFGDCNPEKYSIMCQTLEGGLYNYPCAEDVEYLNSMY